MNPVELDGIEFAVYSLYIFRDLFMPVKEKHWKEDTKIYCRTWLKKQENMILILAKQDA